jgi:arabinose-5-phosphate isomerase
MAIQTLQAERDGIDNLINNFESDKFEQAVQIILNAKGKVIFTGLGKTGHIAKKLAATFASTGTPAFFLHSTESNHGDMGMVDFKNDVLVSISHSGESNESFNTIRICNENGMKIITMTNNDNSTIAKLGNVNLKNFVSKEACPLGLAPTTSTTVTLALGDALATTVMERKNFTPEDFGLSHPNGKLGRRLLKAGSNEVMVALPKVTTDITLKQALSFMNSYRLGCLVVLNADDTLAGFISQGDFGRGLENNGMDAKVSEIMTYNPTTLDANELGVAGYNIMREKDISSIIVVADNKPIGLLDIKQCRHLFT